MKRLENQADQLVHVIKDEIEKTFILPFDKEDIRDITELMDDLLDQLEQAMNRLKIYQIEKGNDSLSKFSKLLLDAFNQIFHNILLIHESKISSEDFAYGYGKLHDFESQGDELHREILTKLIGDRDMSFNSDDPISIIKWKEIFQTLEDTMDTSEDIAIILERLRTKYRKLQWSSPL